MAPGGSMRDLRALPTALHAQWNTIVLDGKSASLGMPSFKDSLSPADAEAIHAYVISKEIEAYNARQNESTKPGTGGK
jgi:quinohemoprotein ethanol dehydrogenase